MSGGLHEAKVRPYFQPQVVNGITGLESEDELELWLPHEQTVGSQASRANSKPPLLQHAGHRGVVTS